MNEDTNRSRNILIGVVVVIIIVLVAIFFIRRNQDSSSNLVNKNIPFPTPISSFQQSLQNNFGITIPSAATKADLVDVTGGGQVGLVTLEKSNGQNSYTVIANLEDPNRGYFYQAWLVNGNETISLGKLSIAKGGWLTNFNSSKDLSDHKKVWVTLERSDDSTPEKHILEGSF